MTDIKIGPSPFWLREKVIAAGMRPINNVVDVTNFVLMEMGQPLHAFDFGFLEEGRIVVRYAEEGDKFTTLDDVERVMPAKSLDDLRRQESRGPGRNHGRPEFRNSAHHHQGAAGKRLFQPFGRPRTAKKLGMSTEASYRFERGTDPDGVIAAANRATQLMVELAGAQDFAGVIDEYPRTTSAGRPSTPIPNG